MIIYEADVLNNSLSLPLDMENAKDSTASTDSDLDQRRATGVVTIVQAVGPRFLDAHEIPQRDFNVVTRSFQNNNTQRWRLTQEQGNVHRIQQVSSGRFLDAHEIPSLDYRVVTRPRQENNTQLWRLFDFGGAFFTIQQVSSGRFLEAYISATQDFQAITRPEQPGDNLQLWRIVS
jgi:hypothetical protein